MNTVYRPLYLRDFPVVTTDIESAEMIKYAANAFLAAKITFINEIAMLCEKVGADVKQVSKGIGLDGRIGNKFLHAGPGYGGSCFPKDTSALARIGQEHGVPMRITETVMAVNDTVKRRMIDKILDLCGGSVNGKTVAVLGVTFKPNTDDMRDAPSLTIVPALVGGGAKRARGRPAGPARGRAPAAGRGMVRRPLRRRREGRHRRAPDRVERVPRPRPRPPVRGDDDTRAWPTCATSTPPRPPARPASPMSPWGAEEPYCPAFGRPSRHSLRAGSASAVSPSGVPTL